MYCMLYVFFWVIPWRLNFVCLRLGKLCLFHLHRQVGNLPTCLWRWNRQSVPKRRHIKFRRREITQKKTYNKTVHVSDSPSVHHQEFSTVHTTMIYVTHVCWQLANRIRILNLLACCQQTCMTYTIAVCTQKNSWWWKEELSETCRFPFQK